MSNSVKIELDQDSFNNLKKQFDIVKTGMGKSFYKSLVKVAFKIKTTAQLRLTGRGHIITSRLKNSLYVKGIKPINRPDNQLTYSDNKGKTYKSDLTTVSLKENELAIGTNVEYAAAIELGARPHVIEAKNAKVLSDGKRFFEKRVRHPGFGGDSFLYWALKNVDVTQSVGQDMQNDLKFGKYLKEVNTKSGKAMTSK